MAVNLCLDAEEEDVIARMDSESLPVHPAIQKVGDAQLIVGDIRQRYLVPSSYIQCRNGVTEILTKAVVKFHSRED